MNSTGEEKVAVYETQTIDMLLVVQDCINEFERGRQLAYQEIAAIIQLRYNMI